MRDQGTRQESGVRAEITERGPRIIIPLGGEELHITTAHALRLRDELTEALRGLGLLG